MLPGWGGHGGKLQLFVKNEKKGLVLFCSGLFVPTGNLQITKKRPKKMGLGVFGIVTKHRKFEEKQLLSVENFHFVEKPIFPSEKKLKEGFCSL